MKFGNDLVTTLSLALVVNHQAVICEYSKYKKIFNCLQLKHATKINRKIKHAH